MKKNELLITALGISLALDAVTGGNIVLRPVARLLVEPPNIPSSATMALQQETANPTVEVIIPTTAPSLDIISRAVIPTPEITQSITEEKQVAENKSWAQAQKRLETLLNIPYKNFGYKDNQGQWVTWKGWDDLQVDGIPGFNCGGFVLEAVRLASGQNISLEELNYCRQDHTDPTCYQGGDWLWYGYDEVMNLAETLHGQTFQVPGINWQPGSGYLSPDWTNITPSMEKGKIYLGSINKPDSAAGQKHFHVVVILPTDQGISVYESTSFGGSGVQKITLDLLQSKYPTESMFITEIPLPTGLTNEPEIPVNSGGQSPEVTQNREVSGGGRLLWVDAWNSPITSSQQADELIAFAKANGFQRLVLTVRNREYFYFTSNMPKPPACGFDALAYMLDRAPDLVIYAGVDGGWLSAYEAPDYTNPNVQKYIKESLIQPLLAHPHLAGIVLDRWRYAEGVNASPAQTEALTQLTADIHQMINAANKRLAVSVLPDPNNAAAGGQNWADWVQKGDVDELIAMDYFPSRFDAQIDIQAQYDTQTPITALLPDWLRAMGQGASRERLQQMEANARNHGLDIGIYSYASLNSADGQMVEVPPDQPGMKIPAECR